LKVSFIFTDAGGYNGSGGEQNARNAEKAKQKTCWLPIWRYPAETVMSCFNICINALVECI
jgi:hypothetical protein